MQSKHSLDSITLNQILNSEDYFHILGLDQNASDSDIRKNFKILAKKFHPDKSEMENASSAFKKVRQAYENLKDENSRLVYIEKRKNEVSQRGGPSNHQKNYAKQANCNNSHSRQLSTFSKGFASLFVLMIALIVPSFLIILGWEFLGSGSSGKRKQSSLYAYEISPKFVYKRNTAANNFQFWVSEKFIEEEQKINRVDIEMNVEQFWLEKEQYACLKDLDRKDRLVAKKKQANSRKEREYYQEKIENFESYRCSQYETKQSRYEVYFEGSSYN